MEHPVSTTGLPGRGRYGLFVSSMFFFLLMASGIAHGNLLAVRFNASGVLETMAPDAAEADSRNFEPGTPLICRWKTPDVDSVQWTLKDRGIIYTRAYRRCWPTGGAERVRDITYTRDGRYIIADTGAGGLLLTGPRGNSRTIPSPSQYDDGFNEETRKAFTVQGRSGFFVLYTYHQKSILSRLLDRWQSDVFWFPDPENLETHQLILSRTADRVQGITAFSHSDLSIMNALEQEESVAPDPAPADAGFTEGEQDQEVKRQELREKWPWLRRADRVHDVLARLPRPEEVPQEGLGQEPLLIFLINSSRFAGLVPGSDELILYPELDGSVFRDNILAFQALDDHSLLVLLPSALYTVDLLSGTYTRNASFSQTIAKRVYPSLAVTPDRRYAGIMFWTRAHRNEIYIVNLKGGPNLKRLVRGEMDMHFVPGIDGSARFNPNAFNFAPDGLSLVTLWTLKDSQEVRVYRLLEGNLAPLPPEVEKISENAPMAPQPLSDAAGE